ncbi:MAG: hypothetical protein KGI35_07730, partial [Burkholderiales bacterium]|nr:hypothetical protein [Burkholderiales bacterium]
KIEPEALRAALATIQTPGRGGTEMAAFGAAELADLVPALSAAFATAGPGDDVLLLSTSRRNDGPLTPPKSATVRLFIADGRLQFIAHDLRADAWVGYQATHIVPALAFGSRNADSGLVLRSPDAIVRRGDWLALSVAGLGAPAAGASRASAVEAPAAAPAEGSVPSPAPATTSTPPARDSAFYEQQELRLRALTRLRDQGLITPQEFEAKRRAIVDAL